MLWCRSAIVARLEVMRVAMLFRTIVPNPGSFWVFALISIIPQGRLKLHELGVAPTTVLCSISEVSSGYTSSPHGRLSWLMTLSVIVACDNSSKAETDCTSHVAALSALW